MKVRHVTSFNRNHFLDVICSFSFVLRFQPFKKDLEQDHMYAWIMRDRNNSYSTWGSRLFGNTVSNGDYYHPKGLEALKD